MEALINRKATLCLTSKMDALVNWKGDALPNLSVAIDIVILFIKKLTQARLLALTLPNAWSCARL